MRSLSLPRCLFVLAWLARTTFPLLAADPPQEITFEVGVEYSNPDNQHLAMNIAQPKSSPGLRPAVLCIHGGGFRAGTREGYDGLCKQLAERGYVAATTSYRLAPIIAWLPSISSQQRYTMSKLRCGFCGPMPRSIRSTRRKSGWSVDRQVDTSPNFWE